MKSRMDRESRLALAAHHAACWERDCLPADIRDQDTERWKKLIPTAPAVVELSEALASARDLIKALYHKMTQDDLLSAEDEMDVEAVLQAISKALATVPKQP
jgi:hypothetical protein